MGLTASDSDNHANVNRQRPGLSRRKQILGWGRFIQKQISAWSSPILLVVLVIHIMTESHTSTISAQSALLATSSSVLMPLMTVNSTYADAVGSSSLRDLSTTVAITHSNTSTPNDLASSPHQANLASSVSANVSASPPPGSPGPSSNNATPSSTVNSGSNPVLSSSNSTVSAVESSSNASSIGLQQASDATSKSTANMTEDLDHPPPDPSKFHTYNASEEMVWTFFYNLYVSPRKRMLQRLSYEIITEQIGQVGRSYAVQRYQKPEYRDKNITVYLYYNTIGKQFNHEWFRGLTQQYNLTAVHLAHYPTAHETVTLQTVHDFCQIHEDRTVIYLHNKGSFHSTNGGYNQEIFRRLLTFSATHPACLDSLIATAEGSNVERCQTCGLLFQPMPGFHYPGNMWAAKCAYIRQLHPPITFDRRMAKMKQIFYQHIKRPRLMRAKFFVLAPPTLGQGRYASEHWLGSHPNLTDPCHVSPSPRWTELDFNASIWAPNWTVELKGGPGFGMTDRGWSYYEYASCEDCDFMLSHGFARKREFFLLGGALFKMKFLYQALPPANSWVWRWFPDGNFWRRSAGTHPLLTAEQIYNPDYTPPPAPVTNETISINNDTMAIVAAANKSEASMAINVSEHPALEVSNQSEQTPTTTLGEIATSQLQPSLETNMNTAVESPGNQTSSASKDTTTMTSNQDMIQSISDAERDKVLEKLVALRRRQALQ